MTLYKKVGRKYIPVSDTEAYEGLDNGSWMVHIENGSTQCRRLVEPANAALEFAILLKTNKISKYLMEASKARPKSQKLTKAQKDRRPALFLAKQGCSAILGIRILPRNG